MSSAILLSEPGLVCALGAGAAAVRERLLAATQPQSLTVTAAFSGPDARLLPLGQVHAPLLPLEALEPLYRTRCNAMVWTAAQQILPAIEAARQRFGAGRVAVVLGVSTAGLPEGEVARRHYDRHGAWPESFDYAQQELAQPALFLAQQLALAGPAYAVTTACSSGAKALASGARLLQAGLADAVVAGGCDVLSAFTVAGFSALESVADTVCQPLSASRCGINLGEGAALFVLERADQAGAAAAAQGVRLAGWGETGDAHHMSAPDPSGRGAIAAMQQALARAGVAPHEVDYVNLHGTATQQNDAMEARAVYAVLGDAVPVSSTKPLTGHALAAAGALEAAFAWLTLTNNPTGRLPPHWWDGRRDTDLPVIAVVAPGQALGRPVRRVLSNSFAFGGSNACLLLEGAEARNG